MYNQKYEVTDLRAIKGDQRDVGQGGYGSGYRKEREGTNDVIKFQLK